MPQESWWGFKLIYCWNETRWAHEIGGTGDIGGAGGSIRNIQHLTRPISEATASFTADVIGRVWQEMEHRLDDYTATNEAHIELR
jgi:hypothetical protein